jgi:hypothetical protein
MRDIVAGAFPPMNLPSTTDLPREGDVIDGKYRVERVLGAGGMGVVVAAQHLALDERVALKFLLPGALVSQEAVQRFVREARAAVKIKNEHVARVTDVGQLADGSPYMVMEYLEGGDLSGWLAQRGPLPPEQAVDFVLQACEALAEAHTLGIVHRDLKPANLFCIQRTDGQFSVKVLDFGISKLTTVGAPINQMTKTSAVMGSPLYMSPEQMKSSRAVDARTDIWSLGMILFELMTGRHAFDAETITELAIKVATERAAPLRSFRADAPVGLERVVTKCLERDRETRFQTVGELAAALEEFAPPHARLSVERVLGTLRRAGGEGLAPHPAGEARAIAVASPSLPGAVVPAPQTHASWGQTAPGGGGSGKVVAGVAALISLGAIVVLGIVVLHGRGAEAIPATGAGVASVTAAAPSAAVPSGSAPSGSAPSGSAPPASTNTAAAAASASAPVAAPAPERPAAVPRAAAPLAQRGAPAAATSAVAPAPAIKPKANCDPPYYFDAKGTRVFKKECPL